MFDLEIEFLQGHSPPGQLARGLRSVQERFQGLVIREHCTMMSVQVGPEMLGSPDYTKSLQLGDPIVLLMLLEGSTGVCDGSDFLLLS